LVAQPLAPGGVEPVVLRAAVIFRRTPFGVEQVLRLESIKRGIQGPLFDSQRFARNLLDAQENAIGMPRSERDSFKDEKVECSGEERHIPKLLRSLALLLLSCQGEWDRPPGLSINSRRGQESCPTSATANGSPAMPPNTPTRKTKTAANNYPCSGRFVPRQ